MQFVLISAENHFIYQTRKYITYADAMLSTLYSPIAGLSAQNFDESLCRLKSFSMDRMHSAN